MPGPGHNGGKVAYIDTENTFRPNRIRPIAERFDLDPDLVLGNIGHGLEIFRAFSRKIFQEIGKFEPYKCTQELTITKISWNLSITWLLYSFKNRKHSNF